MKKANTTSTVITAKTKPNSFRGLTDTHLTQRERNLRDKVATEYYREFSSCSGGGSK